MKRVNFNFIPQGAVISESEKGDYFIYTDGKNNSTRWDSSKTVIVDTGTKLKEGIIDHHQPGSENASVASIIANDAPTYLNHLREQDDITIVTHFEPDLDAIASCYLVQKFLSDGVLSDLDRLFATYVNEVDSGKLTMDPHYPHTVAAVVNAINSEIKHIDRSQKSHNILDEGLRFIAEVYRLLESDQNLWGDHFLDNMKGFDTYRNKIRKDVDEYNKDFEERSETDSLYLLNRETNVYEQVDFILTKKPECVLWKYYVRGDTLNSPKRDGFIFTCALNDKEDRRQAIISTDPNTPYNLKGLGILLDSLEIEALNKAGHERKVIVGKPRPGFCRDNPWYDGSGGHNFTIVDAPRGYSLLTGDEIISAIKANELWLKIGEDIDNGSFDRFNFDAVQELPHPISFENIDEKAIHDFIEADLEEQQKLIASLKSATEKLQHVSPASEFEKLKRDSLRKRLFIELTNYYNAVPETFKTGTAVMVTDILFKTFPLSYLRDWFLSTSLLPLGELKEAVKSVLSILPENEKFIFLLNIFDKHRAVSFESGVSVFDASDEIQSFYELFNTPATSLIEYEETPLFLLEDAFHHMEDLLVCSALVKGKPIDEALPPIPNDAGNLSLDELRAFQAKIKTIIDTQIIEQRVGENYSLLREKRSNLLNAEIPGNTDAVKRYTITRITQLTYLELKNVLNEMFTDLDTQIRAVDDYRKQLLFLLTIRRFEALLERYSVFLRLRVVCKQTESSNRIPSYLKNNPELHHFLSLLEQLLKTSSGFIWHEDKKQTILAVKETISRINRLKTLKLTLPGLYSLSNDLFSFYSRMLEELETDLNEAGKKVELCFTQHTSLRDDGDLLINAINMPSYFRHILYEVLLTYRRYYQEKIHVLQSELQFVVETDSSSAEDNNLYVDYCNEILNRSIVYDWKKHRKSVLLEKNAELRTAFFKKYFQWQKLTNGPYQNQSESVKKEMVKLNSGIRFAAGKGKTNINKIVHELPDTEKDLNLQQHLDLLSYRKDFVAESSFVPLNLYYDIYDYLSERYIDNFDIANVAGSISAFSTKFPAYIRWFSNTNFLRGCVLAFVVLLFLMGAFDPNIYEHNGEQYRPHLPETMISLMGDKLFNIISGVLVAFWATFVGIAFMVPVVFVVYKVLLNSYMKIKTGEANTLSFVKNIERIEGKQSRLLYLTFIIPLVLIVIQMAKPGTLSMISEFEGLRLLSSIVIIFMLTVYSIYIDIEQKNPKKPPSWITSRTKHMFWLYSLQALVLTVFVIDFLLRFQLSADNFSTPDELISAGISRFIVLEFKWFDIVLMPLFTIIISFLTLFFTFFVNRIFRR